MQSSTSPERQLVEGLTLANLVKHAAESPYVPLGEQSEAVVADNRHCPAFGDSSRLRVHSPAPRRDARPVRRRPGACPRRRFRPPSARNAWTCAVIQERTRMAGNRLAYIHADQGNDGTNRFAGDLRPVIGSKTDVMSLAQSAGIVLPVLSYSSPRFPQPSAKRSMTSESDIASSLCGADSLLHLRGALRDRRLAAPEGVGGGTPAHPFSSWRMISFTAA